MHAAAPRSGWGLLVATESRDELALRVRKLLAQSWSEREIAHLLRLDIDDVRRMLAAETVEPQP